MSVVTVRVDEELHRRVKLRAANANLSVSEFLRPVIEDVAFPGGRYLFTGQDELLGVAIQTYAVMAEFVAEQSPRALERGMANARTIMRERRLVDPDTDPLAELGRDGASNGEAGR
jgi:hypothetical protein